MSQSTSSLWDRNHMIQLCNCQISPDSYGNQITLQGKYWSADICWKSNCRQQTCLFKAWSLPCVKDGHFNLSMWPWWKTHIFTLPDLNWDKAGNLQIFLFCRIFRVYSVTLCSKKRSQSCLHSFASVRWTMDSFSCAIESPVVILELWLRRQPEVLNFQSHHAARVANVHENAFLGPKMMTSLIQILFRLKILAGSIWFVYRFNTWDQLRKRCVKTFRKLSSGSDAMEHLAIYCRLWEAISGLHQSCLIAKVRAMPFWSSQYFTGAEVNKATLAGKSTPLHRAAFMGHTPIVKLLWVLFILKQQWAWILCKLVSQSPHELILTSTSLECLSWTSHTLHLQISLMIAMDLAFLRSLHFGCKS